MTRSIKAIRKHSAKRDLFAEVCEGMKALADARRRQRTLAKFEAERDVWQEVLDGVREIKAGGGKRMKVEAKSHVVRVRMKSGLSQAQFAAALGVSRRTLEQWEQGRRKPSG